MIGRVEAPRILFSENITRAAFLSKPISHFANERTAPINVENRPPSENLTQEFRQNRKITQIY